MSRPRAPSPLDRRLAALSATRSGSRECAPTPPKSRKQRSEAREPVFRFATVIINGDFQHKAVIRDIGGHGARIVLEGMHALPQVVTLKIAQTGARLKARVVWQRDAEAGLAFEQASSS